MYEKRYLFKIKNPRRFVNDTQAGEDWYPVYRRLDANATLNIRGRAVTIDNRWIVPNIVANIQFRRLNI